MRSLRSARLVLCALMVATLFVAPTSGRQAADHGRASGPSEPEISRALTTLAADPNLASERTIKTLRWKASGDKKRSSSPAWLDWLGSLFLWIAQSARLLVWIAAAVLAAVLGVYVYRLVRAAHERAGALTDSFTAPTHVHDLDIRPESLPDDVGGAARALWDGGEQRAALALLYRGLLSRLAHVHRVPIRDSTTEGDCLALTVSHLAADKHAFTAQLVGVWQRSVYGREPVAAATVYALCDAFAGALDASGLRDELAEGSAA